MSKKILEIKDLHVSFDTYAGEVKAVRGVCLSVDEGEVLAIVGESGCGKSVTANSILKLIPKEVGRIKSGEIIFDGKEISQYSEREMQNIRGSQISMIFQDPMTAIDPTMKVEKQIMQVIMKHQKINKAEAYKKAIEMMEIVGIPDAKRRGAQYPFEFSGGMRQRIMIAIALSCNPKLLIADEPTTALDVTIQSQILDLLKDLQKNLGTSIILITHDLGVVANMANHAAVMYAGKIVEKAEIIELFENPKHPYTISLINSIPDLDCKSKQILSPIEGYPPDLISPPKGCPFSPRCKYSMKVCRLMIPKRIDINENHFVHCWLLHENAPKELIEKMKRDVKI